LGQDRLARWDAARAIAHASAITATTISTSAGVLEAMAPTSSNSASPASSA
jgi:hypothetical protein